MTIMEKQYFQFQPLKLETASVAKCYAKHDLDNVETGAIFYYSYVTKNREMKGE